MNAPTANYLARRADLARWPLHGSELTDAARAVVIPALGEYPGLFDMIDDLAANPEALRRDTLVIVVVNNRAPEHADVADLAANEETLAQLATWSRTNDLPLCWVDASSPGHELPPKEGVGLARKIGMDHALARLRPAGTLVCLDADTRVDADYLSAIARHFDASKPHAAVIDYAHPADGADATAITDYERYLRIHELGLRWAGSPYAYTAIGSAMACTASAYVQAGGMNRRQAGEDFYFLQQLAKAGRIDRIGGTVLRPSPRPSHRVPFGTGRRVGQVVAGQDTILAYHPESYRILRDWLAAMPTADATAAEGIDATLAAFLEAQGFAKAQANIARHAANPAQRVAQLHRWFDAFRTLKLFHCLRDHGRPDVPLDTGIATLLAQFGEDAGDTSLEALRRHCAAGWQPRGICA